MRNIHIVTIITIVILLLSIQSLPFVNINIQKQKKEKESVTEVKRVDKKALILANYLEGYDSPLQYHAQDFLDAADKYDIDWRLLPSIAGVESTFGKHTPGGYNAYGWGVYGQNALYFKSWRDGMFTVAKGLRENYVNKGLTNPYAMNRVYAASPTWGGRVAYFMNDLDQFSRKYQFNKDIEDVTTYKSKIAAPSGIVAFEGI